MLGEEQHGTQEDRQEDSLGYKQVSVHHAQVLTDQEDNNRVEGKVEEAGVSEMAGKHVPDAALVQSEHGEGEVVVEVEHTVLRPNALDSVEGHVKSNESVPNVPLG